MMGSICDNSLFFSTKNSNFGMKVTSLMQLATVMTLTVTSVGPLKLKPYPCIKDNLEFEFDNLKSGLGT